MKNGQVIQDGASASGSAAPSWTGFSAGSMNGWMNNLVESVFAFGMSLVNPGWETQFTSGPAPAGMGGGYGGYGGSGSGSSSGGPRIYGMGNVRSSQAGAGGSCGGGGCSRR